MLPEIFRVKYSSLILDDSYTILNIFLISVYVIYERATNKVFLGFLKTAEHSQWNISREVNFKLIHTWKLFVIFKTVYKYLVAEL